MGNDATTAASTVAAQGPAVLRVQAAAIEVTGGPDAPRTARIDRPSFVVGSGVGADLQLSDAKVSREHLRLTLTPAGVQLRDESSKNGTWIGGTRLAEVVLTVTTALELGDTKLLLRIEPDAVELPLSQRTSFGDAIGVSAAMRYLFALAERAASSDLPILIEGESGVG